MKININYIFCHFFFPHVPVFLINESIKASFITKQSFTNDRLKEFTQKKRN